VAGDLFHRALWSPAVAAGRDPDRFATVETLWGDLLTRGVRTPMFRLVRDGETLAPSQYCRSAGVGHRNVDDVVQPNRVVELHRQGATLVLQGLQLTDPHLARFANNVALALDHPVQVNAYLTPRAATGLDLHFDFHDVFVVQLAGLKRWRVWRPLVRTTDPVRRGPRLAMPTFDELGPPALDLTLAAGDCLYLPRGFPHAAEAIDAASSHLTVGVMAVTWHKLLTAAVDGALAEPGLRASLPAGVLGGGDPGRPPLDALLARLDPGLVRAWLADEIWRRQPATRLAPAVAPPAAPRVLVTPGPLLWLRADGARTVLGLGDRHLSLPGEAHEFLAALLAAPGGFDVDGWPGGLDAASRAVVVERLAAEGVVVAA
jgi:lysine-specific demethylase/histidyl-hydroxylase NO66